MRWLDCITYSMDVSLGELQALEATQGAPRYPRRNSGGERSPLLPLEVRPDSPGEHGMHAQRFVWAARQPLGNAALGMCVEPAGLCGRCKTISTLHSKPSHPCSDETVSTGCGLRRPVRQEQQQANIPGQEGLDRRQKQKWPQSRSTGTQLTSQASVTHTDPGTTAMPPSSAGPDSAQAPRAGQLGLRVP